VEMSKIAMLHTSFVFLNNETALTDMIKEQFPNDELIHFVDSDALATVIAAGEISEDSTERMILLAQAAERAGADVIFSACSSLGPAIEQAKSRVSVPIVKVDEAMTKAAAASGSRVGVLATVFTTLAPTAGLVEKFAEDAGRNVEILTHLAEGAFQTMMGGDPQKHDEMVYQAAQILKDDGVDMIVLAQASMTRLAAGLSEHLGLPVLSSPAMGIKHLGEVLHSK
jgi:Asp/Glu/hydantoin racemase